ncbi:MAG: S-layer homology domain-containing protein, partial [Candidatus Margulisiibacteriota bacterium]
FLLGSLSLGDFTTDPSMARLSARSIALGNAYSALADDASALFSNPAGLVQISNLQLGVMQNSALDSIFSLNGVAVIPLSNIVIGLGGQYSGVTGISSTGRDLLSGRIIGTGSSEYANAMGAVAIASLVQTPFTRENSLAVGLTGKLSAENTSGAMAYNSSGFNADFGILYRFNRALKLSLVYHNFLPTGMNWGTSHVSNMEYGMSAGACYRLAGSNQDSLLYLDGQSIDVVAQADLISAYGSLSPRFGVEYRPNNLLSLRGGLSLIDEASSGTSTRQVLKYALGLGVNYQGLRFDYAYEIDPDNINANNSHYLSMLIDILPAKKSEEPEVSRVISYINVDGTFDKLITYKKTHKFTGSVLPDVAYLKVNEFVVKPINGHFSSEVTLTDFGKHVVRLTAYDQKDKVLGFTDKRILYLASFSDVSGKNWARKYIEELATAKVIHGFPDRLFHPHERIKRGEFSTMLVRSKNLPIPEKTTKSTFVDIRKHWASPYIISAYNAGLVSGYSQQKFAPEKPSIRRDIVISMVKADDLKVPVTTTKSRFRDVPAGSEFSRFVETGVDNGLIEGYADGTFQPQKSISRAEMAAVFYNSKVGQLYIADLYNWDSYKYEVR